jgi:AcrR family transcriptional regulator
MKQPERRQLSKDALLAAAQDLFVSQGYRQTTIDQIAKSAKLTKGAVYFHFKSKTEILLKLLERAERIVLDPMIEVIRRSAAAPPDEKLIAVIHNQAMLGETQPNEVLLLVLTSLTVTPRSGLVAKKLNEIYDRMYGEIERIIAAGQQSGLFRSDITVREAAAIFMASHDGTFLEWYRRRAKLNGQELVRALRRVILSGLLARRRN